MATNAGADDDDGDGEEDDSSSSEIQVVLQQFQEQWQQELLSLNKEKQHDIANNGSAKEENMNWVEKPNVTRRGMQVDEIDCAYEGDTSEECCEDESNDNFKDESNNPEYDDDSDLETLEDLTLRFQKILLKEELLCVPECEQKMTHISALPMEVMLFIFKWVVSSELDLRSLEQLSLVCRGFFVCARDPELWKLACLRVWGIHTGSPVTYGSWRNMFIERPRLRYNGAYISKTTYIRHGENSFQDQFYRPWHAVEYFRYMRFFPDGIALMLTTPDDPYSSLAKLRYRTPKHAAVLTGQYYLHGTSVIAILKRPQSNESCSVYQQYRRQRQVNYETAEQTFHMELEIKEYNNKANYVLAWRSYSIHTLYRNGSETVSEFDLVQNQFPAFWFSRVKSYSCDVEDRLQ